MSFEPVDSEPAGPPRPGLRGQPSGTGPGVQPAGPQGLGHLGQDPKLGAWLAFLLSYRAVVDRLEDELRAERGMSLSWFDVLIQLARAGGRLRMNQLAASLVLSKSGLTRRIDRMEAAGYVTRESSSSDRRGAYAVLTDAGLEALEAAQPVHLRGIEQHFSSHLSDDDACTLENCLGVIGEAATRPPDTAY